VYVYYEQYDYIRGVAVSNIIIALTAVFLACLLVSSLSVALVTAVLVASLVLSVCAWTWVLNPHGANAVDPFGDGPYGVDLNAVFVVNLITAAGLGVEFLIHIASAYLESIHTEAARLAAQQQGREGEQQSPPSNSAGGEGGGLVGWWKAIKWLPKEAREKHLQGALVEMGSSVVTGITFTKLVGVAILAMAPSQLFRLYYFRE
jgi:Niemann-Pick C1 protein